MVLVCSTQTTVQASINRSVPAPNISYRRISDTPADYSPTYIHAMVECVRLD
jgi:hypothetical protein